MASGICKVATGKDKAVGMNSFSTETLIKTSCLYWNKFYCFSKTSHKIFPLVHASCPANLKSCCRKLKTMQVRNKTRFLTVFSILYSTHHRRNPQTKINFKGNWTPMILKIQITSVYSNISLISRLLRFWSFYNLKRYTDTPWFMWQLPPPPKKVTEGEIT